MANKMLQSLKFPGLSDDYLIPLMQDFAPVYDSTATYAVGDYCTHDNKFYVCTTAISTAEAWTVGHWNQVSVADIATAIGSDIDDLKEALTQLDTRVDNIEEAEGLHRYGVSGIGQSASALTRLWDAVGMTAQVGTDGDNSNVINNFDDVTPFNRRKCVGKWHLIDGKAVFRVHAYYGE